MNLPSIKTLSLVFEDTRQARKILEMSHKELTFKKNPPADTETWEPLSESEQEEKIQQELQNIRLRNHSK